MSFFENTFQTTKKAFWLIVVFSFIMNALMMTVPLYMLQIYDRVFSSRSLETLFYLTLVAIFALLILTVLDKTRSLMLLTISNWLDNQLSPEALRRSADELILGNVYPHQVLRDIGSVRQFLCGPGMLAVIDGPWAPIYLVVIYFLNPVMGIVATIGMLILFSLAVINEMATRTPVHEAGIQASQAQFQLGLALKNAETIQAMGMMHELVKHWFVRNAEVLSLQTQSSKRGSTISSITRFFRMLVQIAMLGVGAYMVIHNNSTGGIMIAATILLSRALAPVEQAIGTWTMMLQSWDAYGRLKVYFDKTHLRETSISLPKPQGHLTVHELTYTLPNYLKPTLTALNFEVKPGEILVILGASASGKTTLARLLVGALKPTQGSIRLDGADVFTWPREEFGSYVGYLPQNVELFPGTIKANIARMGDGEDANIITAGQKAGVHHMILKLPQGYETDLPDAGAHLSGGQRQRLALARALYGDPVYLVLDEPNASLDTEGEEALLNTLRHERDLGKTIILISHKPNVLAIADKVMVLREGHIDLFGPRDLVLTKLRHVVPTTAAASRMS